MLFGEPAQDTVGSRESIGATTGKTDRSDTADQVLRLQQIGLAGARSSPALVHGTSGAIGKMDNRGPRAPFRVDTLHVSDTHPGHIGDRIVDTGDRHHATNACTRLSCTQVSQWYTPRCGARGSSSGNSSGMSSVTSSAVPSASR